MKRIFCTDCMGLCCSASDHYAPSLTEIAGWHILCIFFKGVEQAIVECQPGRNFWMKTIPLVRAAHLLTYTSSLREIGAPVDRELVRAKLPTMIEDCPDAYLSMPQVLEFVDQCSRDLNIVEFGHHAALSASISGLSQNMQSALLNAPTGLALIQAFAAVAPIENTAISVGVQQEGSVYRIYFDLIDFRSHHALAGPEWVAVHSSIEILRSVCGADWCPGEITIMSHSADHISTEEAYPNTRIKFGQLHTSVTVPVTSLAVPCVSPAENGSSEVTVSPGRIDFVGSLRRVVAPYLQDAYPSLNLMAEITGLSRRTLQRALARHGKTYTAIVQEARFENACALLDDLGIRIIDVAFTAGYEHPQHFTRAFRKYTGLTPSQYRRRSSTESSST
ncbi:helix-turn-helix domain-containing protein [Ruegeria sp. A3M17]|uniref:helix-turn-helix domain-containing protein n=1 Tax=Ruegeria sp. A3M17 TaxID=2267229 RepID=UPI000DEBB6F2|nr:helix-turn-helix domain-containing protein [Ruegeria sp. A3M17]RBW54998.1 AraC family transcriptional regulator [Ruegeria sp. A3M17]